MNARASRRRFDLIFDLISDCGALVLALALGTGTGEKFRAFESPTRSSESESSTD
jgi:hypothetical protein